MRLLVVIFKHCVEDKLSAEVSWLSVFDVEAKNDNPSK